MTSSNHLKSNGAKLIRLIVDVGTKTLRNYFDSIHPPATLNAVLCSKYHILLGLRSINGTQMQILFPPNGVLPALPSTSNDYDITLLFILISNICGLTPPASIHGGTSWHENPPLADNSPEADLARIKYYRNKAYAQIKSTEVSDDDFLNYWNAISSPLVRLGANAEDIRKLMTSPLDEEYYLNVIIETREDTRTIKAAVFVIFAIMSIFCLSQFLSSYIHKKTESSFSANFTIPGFVGREWVFRQIEMGILNTSDARGVLLIADPGWGKTALIKRLISSPSSSAIIHENIIAYHFCKYNDKLTRDGKLFVEELVRLIDQKLFKKGILTKNQQQFHCIKIDPFDCFQKAVIEPLQKLDSSKRNNSFILIDALDECLEKKEGHQSTIVNILLRKVPELPNWVKLIVTSRNQPKTTSKMEKNLLNLTINMGDQHNEQDLHVYANQALQNLITATSSNEEKLRIKSLINHAIDFSKGNFLFLKTIIKYWEKYPEKMSAKTIPESLEDIYAMSFTERFEDNDLDRFEPFLEVLLAKRFPLTLVELDKILNCNYQNYNTRKVANKLSEFFKTEINQGPLEFHHQFFAEWLYKQTDGSNGITIQVSRGHEYIVRYLFHFDREKSKNYITFSELISLGAHVVGGGKATVSKFRKEISSLKVSHLVNSHKSMRTILHELALVSEATELLSVLIEQFDSIDIEDYDDEWTPLMDAVHAGNYENVMLFIANGADVNYRASMMGYRCSSHVISFHHMYQENANAITLAVGNNYLEIAKLLIKSGAEIDTAGTCAWKPLVWAAVYGRFEMVKLLINNGAEPDIISLHHAAAKNHTEIVRLLLDYGVQDKCFPCKQLDNSVQNSVLFHHCICETALHAAVSGNNLQMTKLILQYGHASVNCKHSSGRTPLMEAIVQKNAQIVKLLITAGADMHAKCKSLNSLYDRCPSYELHSSLYNQYCKPACYGETVIDFAAAFKLSEVLIPFMSKKQLDSSSSGECKIGSDNGCDKN